MNRRYLAAIGLTVVIALGLVIRALIFLHPSPGDGGRTIHVRFQNVDKLAPHTRVTFAGKPVGEVIVVQLLPEVFDLRAADSRPIYSYEVVLAIDSSVRVYKSDEICVKSEGLMGERVIAITPKPLPEGAELQIVGPKDIVFAAPSGSAEDMLREITNTAQKTTQAIDSLERSCDQLNIFLTSLNSGHLAEKLTKMSEKTITTLDAIDSLTVLLSDGMTGRGTLGKLLKDPSLYDNLLLCSRQTHQLISDVNTYGLLFHTNRDWQREMHVRAEEIAMTTPAALTQSTRERFVKISHIMSELDTSVKQAAKTLDRGTLTKHQALREEFSQGLYDIQQQLDNLSEAIHNAELDTPSENSDEEIE